MSDRELRARVAELGRQLPAIWADPQTGQAKRKELLRCLIEHQGRVVSREQIIAATWGPDHPVDVRTVDQNIKRLRRHLDGERGRSMIQTRRGCGYRLNVGPLARS